MQKGWLVFKVNKDDLTLKQGRFKRNILRAPIVKPPFDKEKEKTFHNHHVELDFTIEIFRYTNANRHEYIFRRYKRPKKKEKKTEDEVDLRPFIPNDVNPYVDKQFEKGAGVDFYVDGARYLYSFFYQFCL